MKGVEENFWSKVAKAGPEDCWLWLAGHTGGGYGAFCIKRRVHLAHRISWQLATGRTLEPGKRWTEVIRHKCDVRDCVNPAHLEVGTQADNMNDMKVRGRAAKGGGHGSRLHPETRCRGNTHPGRKVTAAQAEEIRALYVPGKVTQKEVGRMFGICQTQVSHIVRGRHWKGPEL